MFNTDAIGRPKKCCSNACRQKAYRQRRSPAEALAESRYRSGPGWTLHVGHAATVLELLPEGSVQIIVTSPPHFGLPD